MSTDMVKNGAPTAGMTVREEFGGSSTTVHSDMRSAALAAQETAKIQARYIVAMQRPRDFMGVRTRVLAHCQRPYFAKCARYAKPMGKKQDEKGRWVQNFVTGPSIRFVETALLEMSNIDQEVVVIADMPTMCIIRVTVTDIERNTSSSTEVTIEKTVERSSAKDGRTPISSRKNSYGGEVFTLPATEDEMRAKTASAVSKALRTVGLRVIPGDIVEEAMDQVIAVQNNEDAKDPTATRRKIADYFVKLGVTPEALAQYLGHTIDTVSPAELADLRAIGQALSDGETTWAAVMAERFGGEDAAENAGQPARGTAAMKDKLKAQAAADAPATAVTPPAKSEPAPTTTPATPAAPPERKKHVREPGDD